MEGQARLSQRIIVALDVGTKEKALSLVKQLEQADIFKVGLKLFTAEGPTLLQDIQNQGKRVFLDLKLHDIPNTVAGAVEMGLKHGVHMLTLHASGGKEMMSRAVEAAAQGPSKPLLLAVTILTSLKDEELMAIGMVSSPRDQVLRLAGLAQEAGMDGVVCSPKEIDIIRRELGQDLLVVTPGIRPLWASPDDQKRIMTPAQAVKRGADYMVVGRPIIAASSPSEAFWKILEELESAVNSSHGKDRS